MIIDNCSIDVEWMDTDDLCKITQMLSSDEDKVQMDPKNHEHFEIVKRKRPVSSSMRRPNYFVN